MPHEDPLDYRQLLGHDVPAAFEFENLVQTLARHEVDYVVIGGMADTLHGSDFLTTDADLLVRVDRDNLSHLDAALQELGADRRSDPDSYITNPESFTTQAGNVDVFQEAPGVGTYVDAVATAWVEDFDGHNVRYLDLETLIRSRQAAGRPNDQLRLTHLYRIARQQGYELTAEQRRIIEPQHHLYWASDLDHEAER
jgi:hypothetical protein